jgi:hypothetical protein
MFSCASGEKHSERLPDYRHLFTIKIYLPIEPSNKMVNLLGAWISANLERDEMM